MVGGGDYSPLDPPPLQLVGGDYNPLAPPPHHPAPARTPMIRTNQRCFFLIPIFGWSHIDLITRTVPGVSELEIRELGKNLGSCVLRTSAVECRSILLIYTLDKHFDRQPDRYSARWTLFSNCLPVVGRLKSGIDRKKVYDSRPTVDLDVHGASIECQPRY